MTILMSDYQFVYGKINLLTDKNMSKVMYQTLEPNKI
jgi:hypothetical protein